MVPCSNGWIYLFLYFLACGLKLVMFASGLDENKMSSISTYSLVLVPDSRNLEKIISKKNI
jgi:hypothetical protein